MSYIEFLRTSSQKCVWWWFVGLIITVVSAIVTAVGKTPLTIKEHWYLWVIAVLLVMFFGVNTGAWKLYNEKDVALNALKTSVTKEREEEWEMQRVEVENQKRGKARKKISDLLRFARDAGKTEDEMVQALKEFSPLEIDETIRYWEREKMVRLGNGGRWTWISSSTEKIDGWC